MPFGSLFVPDFPVEAIVRAEPELRSQAVAVLEGKLPLEKVLAVNQEARQAGVCPAMTKLQAELCEPVILRDRSRLQELAAHRALLDCAHFFSPHVEDVACDTLLLDLAGLEKLFGPLPKIVRAISRRASEMGLRANVAVAFTLEAALLAARGFSGVTLVPQGKEAEVLGSLPVEVLFSAEDDPEKTGDILATLRRWGIAKFRDLAALPEIDLSERLGQCGLALQRKARGIGARTLVASDPPLVFEEALESEYPLVLLESLALVLNRMLEQLCARLRARALAAQELRLELTLESGFLRNPDRAVSAAELPRSDCETTEETEWQEGTVSEGAAALSGRPMHRQDRIFHRTIHLPVPLLDPKTCLTLLQLDLNAHPPGAPIKKVLLRIQPAKPRPAQNRLFQPSSPEAERLEVTLARIAAVVGEERVGSPALLDTYRHDAFELRHFTPSPPKDGNGSVPNELVTALRIFRPPVAVKVSHQNGRPSHVTAIKQKQLSGEILWTAGPWRSSGDWWEQDAWICDEWDIALQEQAGLVFYRLVHDVVSGHWVLEGEYD
jgi:protein ImuB